MRKVYGGDVCALSAQKILLMHARTAATQLKVVRELQPRTLSTTQCRAAQRDKEREKEKE